MVPVLEMDENDIEDLLGKWKQQCYKLISVACNLTHFHHSNIPPEKVEKKKHEGVKHSPFSLFIKTNE